jgi:hypothetical protein
MTEETETEQTEFSYRELSAKAQEKARDWFCSTLDYEWWEHTYSYATEQGKERGFDIEDIRFSGFCSQGDGASWTGRVDLRQFLEHHLKEDNPEYGRYFVLQALLDEDWVEKYVTIERYGYLYVHSGQMREGGVSLSALDGLDEDSEERLQADGPLQRADVYQLHVGIDTDALVDELLEWIIKEAREYADGIYADLEAEHEHLTSEESLIEGAYANGWRFDEDGDLV